MGAGIILKLHGLMDKEAMVFLEIDALLKKIKPLSHYGKRLLSDPEVYFRGDEQPLRAHYQRLREVEPLWKDAQKEKIGRCLTELKNISHSLKKIEERELPSVVDYFEIKKFLFFFKRLAGFLDASPKIGALYALHFDPIVWDILDPRGSGQFFFSIDSDYAVELRKQLEQYRDLEKAGMKRICTKLERLYDLSLKNRMDFLLERSDIRNHALRQSDHCSVISENAFSVHYRVIKSEQDEDYSHEIEGLNAELDAEEIRYRTQLMEGLSQYVGYLRQQMANIGELDRDLAMLAYKSQYAACLPQITEGENCLFVEAGVNHDILAFCERKGFIYDPLTIELSEGVTVIVGANMGGKTTSLKTIGQFYTAFALGLPITARRFSSTLFDALHCVYRTREEEGLSGFAMEVKRIRPVFEEGCLLNLIDEFGSATNPKEGDALASSVVKHLSEKESVSVFVTHFSGPLDYGNKRYQTGFLRRHGDVILDGDNIYQYIDHRLEPIEGTDIPQAAIEISRALGLPSAVIEGARKIAGIQHD